MVPLELLNCQASPQDYGSRDGALPGGRAVPGRRRKQVGIMEILSVLMVVTGALMLAHFAAFLRVRFEK